MRLKWQQLKFRLALRLLSCWPMYKEDEALMCALYESEYIIREQNRQIRALTNELISARIKFSIFSRIDKPHA
jgi:hypothetical protein